MINRDSVVLWMGAIGALVMYLQNADGTPRQWDYNQWLQFVAFVVAFVSGKLGTSPLKGENDDQRVGGGPRLWFLPLILAASIGVSSCLPKHTPTVVDPAPTAEQVQAIRETAEVLAKAVREASALAVQAGRVADQAYAAGIIPATTMQQINQAGIAAANSGLAFVEFARTVTTEPGLKATVKALLAVFDDYIDALTAGKQGGETIRAALAALRSYLGVAQ